jgi:hypothetical protein
MLSWCVRLRLKNLKNILEGADGVTDEDEKVQLEHAAVKTVHDFLLDNVPVHGVPGITRALVHTSERVTTTPDGALAKTKEWVVDTEGTNLRRVLTLPHINKRRTISNDIHETLRVLGIEAAQQVLLSEIRAVLSYDDAYVNDRHLQLLVDVMTLSGTLTAMTRHSMHKLGGSIYHQASFEETQDVLMHAAASGVRDGVNGVTENIMMGMPIPGGTGCCDVITPLGLVPHPVVVKPMDGMFEQLRDLKTRRVVAPMQMPTSSVQPLDETRRVVRPMTGIAARHNEPAFLGKRRRNTAPANPPPGLRPMLRARVVERSAAPSRAFAPNSPQPASMEDEYLSRPLVQGTRVFRPMSPKDLR